MTKKFLGEVTLVNEKVIMPSETKIPEKKDWFHYSIWEFNGKAWKPVSELAKSNLEKVINSLKNLGFTHATKPGKLKPSSLSYAIRTTGVEDFTFVK